MNFVDIMLSSTADAAIEALISSAGLASIGGAYQPEEPEGLQEFIAERAE